MYAVSDAYIASMAADLREMPSFLVTLFNADNDANHALFFSYDPEPLQFAGELNHIGQMATGLPYRATLERDWLRANGQYVTTPSSIYIGAGLSLGEPDEEGLFTYPIPDAFIIHSQGSAKPLSLIFDDSTAMVEVIYPDNETETFRLEPSSSRVVLSLNKHIAGETIIRIISSYFPFRRPRIYGVYAATITVWDCDEIVGINLEDENDLVCLELPSRSVDIAVNNLDGKMNPETEITNPTFHKKETQAMLSFVYNGEDVPIGRLFLDHYTVDRKEIRLSFDWAMLPLSDSTYSTSWADELNDTVPHRIGEVVVPVAASNVLDGIEENTAEKYRITINEEFIDAPTRALRIRNPYPIGSRAVCLQLLCNVIGHHLIPGRKEDIVIAPSGNVVRRISYGELVAEPEYSNQETPLGVTVQRYDQTDLNNLRVEKTEVSTGEIARIELEGSAVPVKQRLEDVVDESGSKIGEVIYAARGPILCVWLEMIDSSKQWTHLASEITISALNQKETAVDFGMVPKRKLDNPLVDSFLVSAYASSALKNFFEGSYVTIKHRGFPELDCCDVVEVQLSNDGNYAKAQIVQNKWEFKTGVLSGSTKLRLITEVS